MKLNKKKFANQPTMMKKSYVNEYDLGVDQDEQAMNGEYGMLETEQEDRLPDSNPKRKQ
ncbi:DUF4021 domain-containing protein [Guptibacillus hwajinpoensis]|uniref:DUF4021 domain-containing protein n=2 Tax=Guptibacillus hwajinpoensis TaxID=208199 RepID=A0ABU0K3W9_9BACL|nr:MULTISPECIES: DUF4021 domain-containing protein [Bacillaceae]MDP4552886.1 DUF4021 domain-containing protein [Alkalihalobacillus macyae]MDQ0484053.1 hypothetical protein [Alkalihalobacillus hemicentroti]